MRKYWLTFAAAMLVAVVAKPALAQEWPQQNIRIVVSFGPGGGADIVGRVLAEAMQAKLGKPVIIENRPGAGGILGNDVVAKAAPSGYTLGIMTAGQIIASVTKKNMPYDTLTAFAPVTQVATASLMIVARPDFPANNVKELVAVAKADPNKVVFASPGFAATQPYAQTFLDSMAIVKDFWAEPSYASLLQATQKRFHDYVVAGQGTPKEALDALVADWTEVFEDDGKL